MNRLSFLFFLLSAVALGALGGCEKPDTELRLADLTEDEHRYVTRMVILERAKAVALVDRTAGYAVLDSLSAAWGDSALARSLTGVPDEPVRSHQVHGLLARILEAERDSLVGAARPDRVGAPILDPDTGTGDADPDPGAAKS